MCRRRKTWACMCRSCAIGEEARHDPQQAFPGHRQMKPEQLEIARLKREVIKLKAERDILKKAAVSSIGRRNSFCKFSGRRHEAKSLSWSGVKLECDSIQIVLAIAR